MVVRKRGRGTSMCVCLCAPPTGYLSCNLGMCPDWDLTGDRSFGLQASTQSTELTIQSQNFVLAYLYNFLSSFLLINLLQFVQPFLNINSPS